MSKYVEIGYPIYEGMPVYPGLPEVKLEPRERLDKGDAWNGSVLSMYLHVGTHVDAPWHHLNNGKGIDAVPIEEFIYRKPLLIDCPLDPNGFITIEMLQEYEELHEADILIFNTSYWKHRDTDFEKYANNRCRLQHCKERQQHIRIRSRHFGGFFVFAKNYAKPSDVIDLF
jgi:kynurenine formamidase